MGTLLAAIDRVAFTIGSLEVRWYGLIIVIGMIFGLTLICVERRRIGLSGDDAIELFLWIIPLAIVFARFLYVVVRPDEYFPWHSWSDFVDAIAIWDGGITIIGGILGGIIGVGIFAYRKRKICNFGQVVDLVIVPLLCGQIIGRLGNFINQEAFGIAITNPAYQKFPFAVYIDDPSGTAVSEGWYAATFFYEMVWNTIGAIIFYLIWRKNKRFPGVLGFCYFFWYFLGRGLLEFIRLDAVPITQVACFVLVPISALLGGAYILARTSMFSFRKVNDAFTAGKLGETELGKFDVANYGFACKWLSKSGKVAWKFYGVDDLEVADLSEGSYIPKPGRSRRGRAAEQ